MSNKSKPNNKSFCLQTHILAKHNDVTRKCTRTQGAQVIYEENHSSIWIIWLETGRKFRSQGHAKTLIQFLNQSGKTIYPGTFTKLAKPLEKYFLTSQNPPPHNPNPLMPKQSWWSPNNKSHPLRWPPLSPLSYNKPYQLMGIPTLLPKRESPWKFN